MPARQALEGLELGDAPLQAGLLMVAAADGSVRVWRDYTYRGSQRLATAWQVPQPAPPGVLLLPTQTCSSYFLAEI